MVGPKKTQKNMLVWLRKNGFCPALFAEFAQDDDDGERRATCSRRV
jgi:hypothetical protein